MRYLSGVSFNSVVREQSAGYFYSFASFARDLWRACATAAYACMSLCLHARRSAGCLISHLHAYQCVLWVLLFILLRVHASMCDTHIRACIYVCVSHKKSCILIRSQRPFRGSNPPGCDFPPLVLRGWGDWDCLGQLSLLHWGNNATVYPLSFPLLPSSSPPLFLTFLDILMTGWVRTSWSCCRSKSFTIWHPVMLGVCDGQIAWCCCTSIQEISVLLLSINVIKKNISSSFAV